ncbi:plant-specific TFIIB-related protein 1-like [Spinacia oleracea]|uniref:Plant-specific TFIIB-related protein 1-like n=1 Tax=Spinacia oleracea TaxID=3562 RepID=A0ABM3R042_SPIOL|nr:plant-specific TFIIB-related protein 1-like [Spinacia oleracea]
MNLNLSLNLQIVDVASILGLDRDISDHAFQLFRDCSSATCLRNRSVEALATACLVQAIREAQEPRTLQEISIAANLPQKEIGKYIKILGEALQLSQPINSNSIAVHMPRFCNLLQLNKSAQVLENSC